jgi:hypothetical protein
LTGREHETQQLNGDAQRHGQILSENSWRMTSINDNRLCCVAIFGVGSLVGEMREVTT